MPLIALYPSRQLTAKFHGPQCDTFVEKSSSPNSFPSNVVPRDVVPQHHIQRSGRATLFPVTFDVHPLRSFTAEHQSSQVVRVTVIIHDDFLVLSEQVLEVGVRKGMRVRPKWPEDHEIGHINYPHTKLWGDLPKERGSNDNFKGNFCANSNKDDIRSETLIGGAEPPDTGTGAAMNLRLLRAEPNSRGVLRADHKVDVIFRVDAMSDRAQEAVGVRWEVDTSGVSFEIEDGPDERRVLMGETVVLLTSPGRCLEVVERGIRGTEVGLFRHLYELGILDHHCLCNSDEGLVRREKGSTPGHRVTLKHP